MINFPTTKKVAVNENHLTKVARTIAKTRDAPLENKVCVQEIFSELIVRQNNNIFLLYI